MLDSNLSTIRKQTMKQFYIFTEVFKVDEEFKEGQNKDIGGVES